MKTRSNESGFSLVELLIVVLIIGVIATLAMPALNKARVAAENGNTFGTLRSIASSQLNYFAQNSRYATLAELNTAMSNSLGNQNGDQITHGKFIIEMTPTAPTDPDIRSRYTITATRNVASEGVIYRYEVTQSGELRQILP